MKDKPCWTLEGNVLDVLGEDDLSLNDKLIIARICREFEKTFTVAHDLNDKRGTPDYQDTGGILKALEGMGYKLPDNYKDNYEKVLYYLIEGEIAVCAPKKDIDIARRVFLNRRFGRPALERDGD